MKIVIDIPEDEYNIAKYGQYGNINVDIVRKAMVNGIPLPKRHGRLVDADEVLVKLWNKQYNDPNDAMEVAKIINEAPTIIEGSENK